MKNEKIAIVNLESKVVELCSDFIEVQDVMSRFESIEYFFKGMVVMSEQKAIELLGEENMKVVNYYDEIDGRCCWEMTYNEYVVREEKNAIIRELQKALKEKSNASVQLDDIHNGSYSKVKENLNDVVNKFLDMEDEDEKFKYIDEQYVTIGINGNNHNFDICADLYNELDALLGYMEELS